MIIKSKDNDKVKELVKLQQKKYRTLHKKYLVLNDNAIEEALLNDLVEQIIITDKYDGEEEDLNTLIVTEEVMKKITNQTPIPKRIAVVRKKEEEKFEYDKVLLIDRIQDPGNLGTIIRTAHALGIEGVFVSDETVDVYNPKVISAMQGVQFSIPIKTGNLATYIANSKNKLVTTFLDEESNYQKDESRFDLLIGNEGNGIDKEYKKYNHENFKLETKYESLNVAIATGIILYEMR